MIADVIMVTSGGAFYASVVGLVIRHGWQTMREARQTSRPDVTPDRSGILTPADPIPLTPADRSGVRGLAWSCDDATASEWLNTLRQPTLF